MWDEVWRLAVENGMFALLFCTLLFYILKDAKKREEKYVGTIVTLGERLRIVEEIKEDTQTLLKQVKPQKKGVVNGI